MQFVLTVVLAPKDKFRSQLQVKTPCRQYFVCFLMKVLFPNLKVPQLKTAFVQALFLDERNSVSPFTIFQDNWMRSGAFWTNIPQFGPHIGNRIVEGASSALG